MKAVSFALFSACLVLFLNSNAQADYEAPRWERYHVVGTCFCIELGDDINHDTWYPVFHFDFVVCAMSEHHIKREIDIDCQNACFSEGYDAWGTVFQIVEQIAPTCDEAPQRGYTAELDFQ